MSELSAVDWADVQLTEHILERMKVASAGRIGSQVLRDTRLETWVEPTLDQMAMRLSTYLIAERLLEDEASVAFSGPVAAEVETPKPRWLIVPQLTLSTVLCAAALPLHSLALFLASSAVLLLSLVVYGLNPPTKVSVTTTVHGNVTVRATYFAAFPENNTRYPDGLGTPIRIAELQAPYWEQA